MRTIFYPKLAYDGIRKNKRMFLPFLFTCIGMVMMFYIIMFLASSNVLDHLIGAETLRQFFALGSWVIMVFSAIFLFYTNSFLIRRRKKEFGLYHILGMGKRDIARVLFWETLMMAVVSISVGLTAGIAFSKFAELGMVNVMHGEITYDLSISFLAVRRTMQVFGGIFLLLLLNAIRQVHFASAVSLIRSENVGEKPPKGNVVVGMLGIALLAGAYYLAVTIEDPMAAIFTFFLAVVMVIIGTYLVMIAGSVLFCRLLQKKKKYYYKANHFVSVSSMVYRMKRNGAGLASICILATMVLVMISSTACLYFGEESAINLRYPRDINMEFDLADPAFFSEGQFETLRNEVLAELDERGVEPENEYDYRVLNFAGVLEKNTVNVNPSGVDMVQAMNIIYLIPLADYNRVTGENETLADDEALVYANRKEYQEDTISLWGERTFRIKKILEDFPANGDSAMNVLSSILIVVPNLEKIAGEVSNLADFQGDILTGIKWIFNFDTGTETSQQIALYHDLIEITDPAEAARLGYESCFIECQENERADFYGMFGALFYIGILLSIVFLLAAVLMIYYKQISEGYEDQSRFEIMQKVGMTKREIRKTINSQLLTVFFLPLLLAVVHIAFAFPLIRRMLLMFNLNNAALFVATTTVSVLVFAVFYTIVYRLTSNAYYKIVSGAR